MKDYMGSDAKVSIFILIALLIIHLQGCSLPRVIIIDDPLSPEEHVNLGLSYEKNGEFDLAEKEYRIASEKFPAAYVYLGNLAFARERLESAESFYRKALESDPLNADALNNLAWLYYSQRTNLDEAEKLAMKALELGKSKRDIYRDTLEKIREIKKEH
jgi:tetratricopeptide (TPR) repeat protein